MKREVRELFEQYARVFAQGLEGKADMDEARALYASEFIAASPRGVVSGKNDDKLKKVMEQGYNHYRNSGMKTIRLACVHVDAVDERHCVAHVDWHATYTRNGASDMTIAFRVHYLVQMLPNDKPRVFGWISGDEQALLKEHGIG